VFISALSIDPCPKLENAFDMLHRHVTVPLARFEGL
jgi:hypothetical protein